MQRVIAFWRSGILGKIVLSIAGLFILLIVCCGIILVIPTSTRTTVTAATAASSIAPTDIPTPLPATDTPELTVTLAPSPLPAPTAIPRGYVSKALMGAAWPLRIDAGTIVCDGPAILLRAPDGQLYAVNGTARGQIGHLGWRDIRNITLPDPTTAGLIMNVQPLVDVGLDLCR